MSRGSYSGEMIPENSGEKVGVRGREKQEPVKAVTPMGTWSSVILGDSGRETLWSKPLRYAGCR